ncbi:MAG: AsnC family protein, partial [Acidimicrobiia bacterium]|nr:AsnC family protein [Acidimicrobiia bacterium]
MTAERRDHPVDELDARLIEAMASHPRAGILEIARLLGVARNTVYARLDRL